MDGGYGYAVVSGTIWSAYEVGVDIADLYYKRLQYSYLKYPQTSSVSR